MGRRSLPQVVIPVPCPADWNAMTRIDREGRARFCRRCERPVYDSAAMTRGELGDLIARHEGRRLPCVQLHRRPDGTVVTRDCVASFLRAGRLLWLKVALGAVAFWAWVLGLRPLAQSVIRQRAKIVALEIDETITTRGGMIMLVVPPDPTRLSPPPPGSPRPGKVPTLGIDPLLPEIDRAAPLRDLEANEGIRKRLEPDRFPPLDSLESRWWRR